jgi:lysophospholipase L1-like esterase
MDIAQKRILIVGDSMSADAQSPGAYLAAQLKDRGAAATSIDAKVGRSAVSYLSLENGAQVLANEIKSFKPDIGIIVLGTNDLSRSVTKTEAAFTTLRDAFLAYNIPVLFIGPPLFVGSVKDQDLGKSYNELANATIAAAQRVFGLGFIDARPMTTDLLTTAQGRAGDLVHFTSKAAQIWGTRMADAIFSLSAARTKRGFLPQIAFGWGILSATAILGVIIARRDLLRRTDNR